MVSVTSGKGFWELKSKTSGAPSFLRPKSATDLKNCVVCRLGKYLEFSAEVQEGALGLP